MRNSKRLGCFSTTGIMAAIITSLVFVGYVYAKGGLLYNPGPLNDQKGNILGGVASHAEIGGDCKACHTAPWDSAKMADRCEDCHSEIENQTQTSTSVHGKMLNDNPELTCRHCHPDHRGPDASLTEMTDADFPHELVGFSLDGHQFTAANEAFVCANCHADDISTLDLQVCDTCHRQIDQEYMAEHIASFGLACLDCHDGMDSLVTDFNHNRFEFKLIGEHTGLECAKCHENARGIGDFQVILQNCYACHRYDDQHGGRYGRDCAECHSENGWKPAKFDHTLSVFKLEGKHLEADCVSCHKNGAFVGTRSDCYSCHQQDDEHSGRFGPDCSACHNTSDWEDADFDHTRSNFPLTGRHVDLTCEQCHDIALFSNVSTTCVGCHGDPVFHAGMFGLDCATCHTTDNWFAVYRGTHPGIADEGGRGVNHGGASCRDCHTSTLQMATCYACHDSNNPDGDGNKGNGDDD